MLPLRYRLSSSLGFQPQLPTELGYGKAIHHLLRRLADLTRPAKKLPSAKQIEKLFEDEFYLPFANRPAFEQLTAKAKGLLNHYLSTCSIPDQFNMLRQCGFASTPLLPLHNHGKRLLKALASLGVGVVSGEADLLTRDALVCVVTVARE